MTDTQKVIKYCAIGFGIMLVGQIFFGIMSVFFIFKNSFKFIDKFFDNNDVGEVVENDNISSDFNSMDFKLNSTSLNISMGDKFSISTNNDELKMNVKNGKLVVIDDKISTNSNYILNVVLPKNVELYNNLYIKSGAGVVKLDNLYVNSLNFKQGAGNVKISNSVFLKNSDIECGAGSIKVVDSKFNGLELELGLGSFDLDIEASDMSEIDVGMGNGKITFTDGLDNYKISASKGMGSFTINGNKVNNNSIYGDGSKKISIEGGVGDIKVE